MSESSKKSSKKWKCRVFKQEQAFTLVLGFYSSIWDPYLQKDINSIEKYNAKPQGLLKAIINLAKKVV